jgi:hypothetical protein
MLVDPDSIESFAEYASSRTQPLEKERDHV